MKQEEILELVNSVSKLTLSEENTNEIIVSFHEIKMKVFYFFPDQTKLLNRINKVEERELCDFKLKHNEYLNGEIELEFLSSWFASLKIAIESDVCF